MALDDDNLLCAETPIENIFPAGADEASASADAGVVDDRWLFPSVLPDRGDRGDRGDALSVAPRLRLLLAFGAGGGRILGLECAWAIDCVCVGNV